jgi:hypothetical protein
VLTFPFAWRKRLAYDGKLLGERRGVVLSRKSVTRIPRSFAVNDREIPLSEGIVVDWMAVSESGKRSEAG